MRKRIVAGLVVVASTIGAVYATTVVRPDPSYPPKVTVAPAVTGTPEVAQQLSCGNGTWQRNPSGYAAAWESSPNGSTWSFVAAGSPYTVAVSDEGDELRCRVTATNTAGTGQALSVAVGPVPYLDVADLFIDDTGTDSGTCTTGAPCLTMNYALIQAAAGDIVDVRNGAYAGQTITAAGKASTVTFRPASGAAVTLGLETATTASAVLYQVGEGAAATVSVGSTTGFVPTDFISANGAVIFSCTGSTATTFTGCRPQSGGSCTAANGGCTIASAMAILQGGLVITGQSSSKLAFRDFTVPGGVVVEDSSPGTAGASEIEFDSITASVLYLTGRVADITVNGGSYGPINNSKSTISAYNTADGGYPDNILIDGAVFHDTTVYLSYPTQDVHTECMQVRAATDLTIRRSVFTNCDATAALAFSIDGPATNFLIENNWFDSDGTAPNAVEVNLAGVDGFVFQHNSLLEGINLSNTCTSCGAVFRGNYGASVTCGKAGVTYNLNLWTGTACTGDNTSVGSLAFVDAVSAWPTFNLRLTVGANAIDKGNTSSYPATDFDGTARYLGAAPDAGSHEKS